MGFGKMVRVSVCLGFIGLAGSNMPASAQQPDLSPTLLLEVGPSDNPAYRRMVFVKYLSNETVTVAYKAYNRTEFIQIPDSTPHTLVQTCLRGSPSRLEDIKAYQYAESVSRRQGKPPTIAHFCIKNVYDWDQGNRSAYLDPIFEGMPQSSVLSY